MEPTARKTSRPGGFPTLTSQQGSWSTPSLRKLPPLRREAQDRWRSQAHREVVSVMCGGHCRQREETAESRQRFRTLGKLCKQRVQLHRNLLWKEQGQQRKEFAGLGECGRDHVACFLGSAFPKKKTQKVVDYLPHYLAHVSPSSLP